jgi:eukaryotic-like serine/threonine-protein kinase
MSSPGLPTAASLEGAILGDTYRVGRRIGAGAMGSVYEATHLRLAGRYAIKVLQPDVAAHPGLLSRFHREASITSELRHPNIVSVLDFNVTDDGRPYLAMELLVGTELSAAIRQSAPMPLPRALDLIGQVASALSAAHALGIVHRDLKPQNLFLLRLPGDQREVVKVLDFGISKVHEATTMLTQTNTLIGTPQYMAPEQAMGQSSLVDHRTDQFALAAITYELLTGRVAFPGDSIPAVLYQVVHETPRPMRELNPKIPAAVEAAVMKALSKKVTERFDSVAAFVEQLTGKKSAAAAETGTPEREPETGRVAVKTTFSGSASEMPELGTLAAVTSGRRRLIIAWGITGAALLITVVVAVRAAKRPAPPVDARSAAVAPEVARPTTKLVPEPPVASPTAPTQPAEVVPAKAAVPNAADHITGDGQKMKSAAKPTAKPAAKPAGRLIRDLDGEPMPPRTPEAQPSPVEKPKPKSRIITDF